MDLLDSIVASLHRAPETAVVPIVGARARLVAAVGAVPEADIGSAEVVFAVMGPHLPPLAHAQ